MSNNTCNCGCNSQDQADEPQPTKQPEQTTCQCGCNNTGSSATAAEPVSEDVEVKA